MATLYLLASGTGLAPFLSIIRDPPEFDRCMVCGSPGMLSDTSALLERLGFSEGSMNRPGAYVIERAFVER